MTTRDKSPLNGGRNHGNHGQHSNQGQHGTSSQKRLSIFHSYQTQLLEKEKGMLQKGHETSKVPVTTVTKDDSTPNGQSPPNCMYSFVVNELDSSKCPMVLQQMQNMQNEQPKHKSEAELSEADLETIDNMQFKMESLQTKLYQEIAENRKIEKDLLEQGKVVQKTERSMIYHEHNITRLMSAIKRLEITLQKQRIYSKNVDNKLAGVMLDVIEVNNRLDRNDQLQNAAPVKSVQVQASSRTACPGVQGENITRYKGKVVQGENITRYKGEVGQGENITRYKGKVVQGEKITRR